MTKPVAVVLGASTGIGAACVRGLAEDGYAVIGFHRGRHLDEANQVRVDTGALLRKMDVGSNPNAVAAGINSLLKGACRRGQVKVFVHALSGASVGKLLAMDPLSVSVTFNHMAHSFLWWAQELHRNCLLAPNAHLIAFTSPTTEFHIAGTGAIGAAKAALEAYVKLLAVELGRYGHTVNAICSGMVLTPAMEKIARTSEAMRMAEKVNNEITPIGRIAMPDDIARMVRFLAKEPWTNGAIIDHTGACTRTLIDRAFGF